MNDEQEKYLGAIVTSKAGAKQTARMLLDKLRAKLVGWKCAMMSHAGRQVLIKAVLMSLPVYFMNTEKLPKGVVEQMTRLLAKFFWGKTDKTRYLALISWKRICCPVEQGGLGVRDLHMFGEALFQKNTWALMRQEDKMWVKVCQAKYYPQIGFWRAQQKNGCSALWREVIKTRDFFKNDVFWDIADGKDIMAVAQPWFQGWEERQEVNRADARKNVAQLYDVQAGQWDEQSLTRIFGAHKAHVIQTQAVKPNDACGIGDRLIWKKAKSGRYTVKEGYKVLTQEEERRLVSNEPHWQLLAKWKGIAPKVKLFMWRLLSRALPLANNLHSRIRAISPMCQRCGLENEFETHCFFYCPGSRGVWFGGHLPMRTHDLPLDIVQAFLQITYALDDQSLRAFAYTMWEIWRGRNEVVMNHGKFEVGKIRKQVSVWMNEETSGSQPSTARSAEPSQQPCVVRKEDWNIIVDASWDSVERVGTAYVVYEEGKICAMGLKSTTGQNPFHAEALALVEALDVAHIYLQAGNYRSVCIFSDCLNLVNAVTANDFENIPAWRAIRAVHQATCILNQWPGQIQIRHVPRHVVQQAHALSNYARTRNCTTQDSVVRPDILSELQIDDEMDNSVFSYT